MSLPDCVNLISTQNFSRHLQQEVSNCDKVYVWLIWSGRVPAWPVDLHGLLSLSRSSLCALTPSPPPPFPKQTIKPQKVARKLNADKCKETPIYFSNTHSPIRQHYKFPTCCLWEYQQNQKVCTFNKTKQEISRKFQHKIPPPIPSWKIWKSAKAQIRLLASPPSLNFKKNLKNK